MNWRKRGIIILECVALILACCACGKGKDITGSAGDKSGTVGLDLSYVSETDCQIGVGPFPQRAYTSNGIYFLEYGESRFETYLKFYDYATDRIVFVCSKSDCSHNDADCMAYLDHDEYPLSDIWYYDGDLYLSKVDGDYRDVEKIALDGSTRTKSCTVMRIVKEIVKGPNGDEELTYYPEMAIHRGYVYYTTYYAGSETADFCRIKLNSDEEAEVLYSMEDAALTFGRIKPCGGYVFFQAGAYENVQNINTSIYKFDIETKETEEYYPEVIRDYFPTEYGLFYLDLNNNIHKADPVTKEDTVIYENENNTLFPTSLFFRDDKLVFQIQRDDVVDDRAIYIYTQIVMDVDGNVIQELSGTQDDWFNSSGNLMSPY